jgi:aspartyl-tRNA(Asn)/glutamyl-tRNA(Gln) amidotransferase subunit A
MTELHWMPATEMAATIRAGDLDEVEVAEHFIARVEAINPGINAIVQFDPDEVRADAAALCSHRLGGGATGPIHGVPYTIKDLTNVAGKPTTFGMTVMKDNIAPADAPIVARMRAAGGLYLGKTNTPESGYYGGTDNHLYGPTHNPWKPGHSAGGSSGGAAAAVAAGLCPLAEGSDGAGSVRIPAALCGVVGLKPTVGIIPQVVLAGRYYTWAYHGPITRTVEDNALMLDVVAGPSLADPMTIDRVEASYLSALTGGAGVEGLRAAWSPDMGLGQYVDPEVLAICREAVGAIETAGVTVTDASPQWSGTSVAMWEGIWVPGFASEHDLLDWPSLRGEVDDNLIELMREAEATTAVQIGNADVVRGGMWDTWTAFMTDFDILISPTLASATIPLEQFAPSWLAGRSLREQLLDWLLTYPYNMLTVPAITVPAGFTADGRPVGLQLAARHRQDALLHRVALALQQRHSWLDRMPG